MIWLVDRSITRQIGDLEAVLRIAVGRGVTEIALHESDLGEVRRIMNRDSKLFTFDQVYSKEL